MGSFLLLTNFCLFSLVGGKLLGPPTGSGVGLFKWSLPFRFGLDIPVLLLLLLLLLFSNSFALPVFTFPVYLSLPFWNNFLNSVNPVSTLPCARNFVYAFSGVFR